MSLATQIFALLALMLALCTVESEARAFFGSVFNNFEGAAANGSSAFATLLAEHAQHAISSFAQLGDLAALGANLTETFFFG